MKLQHTSGAVIEDNLLKETEGLYPAFVQYDAFDKVVAKYPKADWRRVPEERWEKVPIIIDSQDGWAYFISTSGGRVHIRNCQPAFDYRFTIIDGNLCVERRVEG